jgi:putative oxidoreductase
MAMSMTTAIRKVHLPNGPWAANGGWEYNVVLIAGVTALVDTGPGELSLDHLLGTERSGPAWALGSLALGSLALGVAAAAAVMTIGARGTPSTVAGSDDSAVAAAHGDTAGDPTTTDT